MSITQSSTRITTSGGEPVTTAEAKAWDNISIASDDNLIDALIQSAREYTEEHTGRQLMDATWKLTLDKFPTEIKLPKPPLQSVTSITYTDTSGNTQTLDSGDYQVDSNSAPARIRPSYGNNFPSTRDEMNTVTVTYVCGYAMDYSDADAIPENIKTAMKLFISHNYKNREATSEKVLHEVPFSVKCLLSPYIVEYFV